MQPPIFDRHRAYSGHKSHVCVQIGFALVGFPEEEKAPNKFGLKVFALDCIGQDADPLAPLVGNVMVELGIARGAWRVEDIARLDWGQELKPAQEVVGQYAPVQTCQP